MPRTPTDYSKTIIYKFFIKTTMIMRMSILEAQLTLRDGRTPIKVVVIMKKIKIITPRNINILEVMGDGMNGEWYWLRNTRVMINEKRKPVKTKY